MPSQEMKSANESRSDYLNFYVRYSALRSKLTQGCCVENWLFISITFGNAKEGRSSFGWTKEVRLFLET